MRRPLGIPFPHRYKGEKREDRSIPIERSSEEHGVIYKLEQAFMCQLALLFTERLREQIAKYKSPASPKNGVAGPYYRSYIYGAVKRLLIPYNEDFGRVHLRISIGRGRQVAHRPPTPLQIGIVPHPVLRDTALRGPRTTPYLHLQAEDTDILPP